MNVSTTTPYYDFASAIAAARVERRVSRRHQAVVQFRDRLYVCDLRTDSASAPAWTTQEDDRSVPKGKRKPYCKVESSDVPLIHQLHKLGFTNAEIARKFEFCPTTIRRVLGKEE